MPLRILVVGRDVHAREGLRSILAQDGYDVDVAQDIWEGFARVAAQRFDLLLLDDDVRLDGHAAMILPDNPLPEPIGGESIAAGPARAASGAD